MWYRKKKFETFTKKELADRHKQLIEKLRNVDDYSDAFSEVDDNSNDEDFIPAMSVPQKSQTRRLFSIQKNQNKKRAKKEEENQNKGSDEGSASEQESSKENSGTESETMR